MLRDDDGRRTARDPSPGRPRAGAPCLVLDHLTGGGRSLRHQAAATSTLGGARRRDPRNRRRRRQRPEGAAGGSSGEQRCRAPARSLLDGQADRRAGAAPAPRAGLAFVPEERLGRGAVPPMSPAENALLTGAGCGWCATALDSARIARARARDDRRFDVRSAGMRRASAAASPAATCRSSSWAARRADPSVLVAAQPTWGVDVGAALAIRQDLIGPGRPPAPACWWSARSWTSC